MAPAQGVSGEETENGRQMTLGLPCGRRVAAQDLARPRGFRLGETQPAERDALEARRVPVPKAGRAKANVDLRDRRPACTASLLRRRDVTSPIMAVTGWVWTRRSDDCPFSCLPADRASA